MDILLGCQFKVNLQIDESNVYEAVNLISSYRALAACDVLRYAEHVSQWDAACSVHLLQVLLTTVLRKCYLVLRRTSPWSCRQSVSSTSPSPTTTT